MNINLHDNGLHLRFAPLTLTRPVGDLRMGLFTMQERWKHWLPVADIRFQTEPYLSGKFPSHDYSDLDINAAIIPSEDTVRQIVELKDGEALMFGDFWIARKGSGQNMVLCVGEAPIVLTERWQLFAWNDHVLRSDFLLLSSGRTSQELPSSNTLIGNKDQLFIEDGAVLEGAILNTRSGPIYIGRHAEIMEGSVVRGPFGLAEHATLKMGAKVYGATSIGPHCKVGGEVNNVIFQGYSNKGHDGFLGNAFIGEWCNLGADTNASNLKNTYAPVDVYSYESGKYVPTNEIFVGLCMGDHSKCGINTMFNTGTVVGVSANVFGAGFPDKFIPSFTWGGADGWETYRLEKAMENANNMMMRRNKKLSSDDEAILRYLFELK